MSVRMRFVAALSVLLVALNLSGCMSLFSDEPPRAWRTSKTPHKALHPAPTQAPIKAREGSPAASRVTARTVATAPSADRYRVQAGDTLYSIAFRHQMDYRELARINGVGEDYRIAVGQTLVLRDGAKTTPAVRPARPLASEPFVRPATRPVTQPTPSVVRPAPSGVVGDFDWLWPTTGSISRRFAPKDGFKGLDFTGQLGQPVFAAAPGRVVYSGNALKGYGELIIIKHNDVFLSAYGYNRKRHVQEGDVVTAGQPIGELGLGPENKALLHFEIRAHGQPVDPAQFLPPRETVPGVVEQP